MSENDQREPSASSRLAELKDSVHRAAKLIEELRESNYFLNGELAELKRQVEELRADDAGAPAVDDTPFREELDLLREERETVRGQLRRLLERLSEIETRL